MKPEAPAALRQHREVAHDAGGVKVRRIAGVIADMKERGGDGMQDACARLKWGVIESHRMAQHDATLAKRRGQRFVGGGPSACLRAVGWTAGSPYRSGSAKTMSSATVAAPMSLRRAIRSPMRSRRQGHWPIVVRLRSSTSTMTMRPPGGLVRVDSKQDVVRRVVQSSEKRRVETPRAQR